MLDYVEGLRVRRGVPRTLAVLAVVLLAFPIYARFQQGAIRIGHDVVGVPVSLLFGIGGIAALVAAAPFGASLSGQRAALATRWTLPVPRGRTILGVYLADAVAMVAIGVGTTILAVLATMIIGVFPYVYLDGPAFMIALAWIGPVALYYGWVQLLNAIVPERGALLGGLSWLPFIVIVPLAVTDGVWTPLHALAQLLIWVDPLGYVISISIHGHDVPAYTNALGLSPPLSLAISAVLALITLAAASALWQRREI